jgi:hypothetical protein
MNENMKPEGTGEALGATDPHIITCRSPDRLDQRRRRLEKRLEEARWTGTEREVSGYELKLIETNEALYHMFQELGAQCDARLENLR